MTEGHLPEPEVANEDEGPRYGGMQLKDKYRDRLDPRFLSYYFKEFANKRMVYLHWTAGRRSTNFTDYHIVVGASLRGFPEVHENTPSDQYLYAHTYGRNHNSCAISLAGLLDATTNDLGREVPDANQINRFVDVVTNVCLNLRTPVANIMTHAEAADNLDQEDRRTPSLYGDDALPYGPSSTWERWDLHCFIDNQTLRLTPPGDARVLHPKTETSEAFADWIRGQVMLNIQSHTRKYWKGT